MLGNAVPSLLQHVRRLAATASSDEQLLADFLSRRSDDAFAALIGRHGPMVLNVCRRILHDAHAAEDVFQATFLVLADRAGAIHRRAALAGFLHGVAYRLAVRARRRSMQNLPAAVCDKAVGPPERLAWKEMLGILDHELGQLSDRYRAPLVLCYLEGRTQDEAARQLGWSVNTLRRRLTQCRRLLEARLRGRGVTLPAALAGVLAAGAVAVPGPLRAATLAAIGARVVDGLTAGASALASARNGLTLLLSASGKKVGALVALAALGAAVCFGYGWTMQADQPPASSDPTPTASAAGAVRGDPAADPLPAGSTLRFGTSRFRYGIPVKTLAVSPDGKMAFVTNDNDTPRAFDLASGRVLLSPNWGNVEAVAISPDGKTIVIKQDFSVLVRDAATGKELRKFELQRVNSYSRNDWIVFTPNGKAIAVTSQGSVVHLIDFESGKTIRDFSNDNPESTLGEGWGVFLGIAFSSDGKLMASGGFNNDKGVYFARLWDVETGKELRRFMHGKSSYGIPSLAFSSDAKTLATRSHDGRLRLFDVESGKERNTFPPDGGGRQPGSVAFTPDGKTVAAAGDSIRLYDATTGEERLRIDRKQASNLQFTDGGKTLTGAVSGAIYRWDTATGKSLIPEAADSVVEQILVTPDGSRVITRGQDGEAHIWDGGNGKHLRRFQAGWQRGLAISPDGRFLAWPVDDYSVQFPDPQDPRSLYYGSRIRLYDLAADKVVDRFPTYKGVAQDLAFINDGKKLVTVDGHGGMVRIWDFEAGKEERSFHIVPDALKKQSYFVRRTQLSPDGKTVVVTYEEDRGGRLGMRGRPQLVRLWDVTTGKELPELNGGHPLDRAFSPDGRLVVTRSGNAVCETATGKRVAALPDDPLLYIRAAAFSRDGRLLATASADGIVRLWETATWTVRAEFRGHRDRVTALAFGPDWASGRLFTGGLDTVVLGWDVRPPRDAAKGTLANAWEALADAEGKAGFQAQGRFLAEPGKAVEWFAARVTPAVQPDPARVKALIADLDNANFATRARATAGLKELWPATAAALRAVVAKPASEEARRRAEGILREMEQAITPPGALRTLRAAEVLEWIATKEAHTLLLELAKGAPDARLTLEAAAACKRLEGRK